MTTVRQIIEDSLGAIQILGAGESLTSQDANDGLRALNQMIQSWASDGAVVFNSTVDTFSLIGNQSEYTMGPGGDIDTERPVAIDYATITQGGNIVTPVEVFTQNAASAIGFPPLQGYPTYLYVNNNSPLLGLRLYPVPIGGLLLTLYTQKPLTTLTLNTVLTLPPGYEDALIYNLAVRRAPFYEREALKTVKDIAKESLLTIKRNNEQYSSLYQSVDPGLWPRYYNGNWNWFNIYSGF